MYKKGKLRTLTLKVSNIYEFLYTVNFLLYIQYALIDRITYSKGVITTITATLAADVGIFSLVIWTTVSVENTNLTSFIEQLFISEKAYFHWNDPFNVRLVDV